MKTRTQKVFAILAACLLCASFFAVPVYAVDQLTTVVVENEMYEYGSDETDPDQRPYTPAYLYTHSSDFSFTLEMLNSITAFHSYLDSPSIISNYGDSMEFTFDMVPSVKNKFLIYYINQLFDDDVQRTFSKGDTLFIDSSYFEFYPYDVDFTQFRFTLRDYGDPYNFYFGNVVASTDIIDLEDSSVGIEYDRLAFNFNQNIVASELCLCIEFTCDLEGDEFSVEFYGSEFIIQFGSGVSPDYPIYPSAPGGDDVGNLESAEQELIQGSQAGLDNANNNFLEFGNRFLSFGSCFVRVGSYLTRLTGNMPYFDVVVWISLSLGIYASLLGLAGAIVSAADRKAGREAASARRSKK